MAIPFRASISSHHDSCISALIGRLLWGVPDLSDGARFGWLVYILSNMSLWGTGNCIPSRKCQTAVAGLCWHCTLWYYFEESWQRLTHVSRLTGRTLICIQSACSNKQHLMWFIKIRHFWRSEGPKCTSENKVRTSGPWRGMYLWGYANSQQREGMLHRTLQCQQKLQLVS